MYSKSMMFARSLKTFPHNLDHKATLNFEILQNVEISSFQQECLSDSVFATQGSNPKKVAGFSPSTSFFSVCGVMFILAAPIPLFSEDMSLAGEK